MRHPFIILVLFSRKGAELEVLKSINWSLLKIDVMCVEVDPPNRPVGYAQEVTAFLLQHGYVSHMTDSGRNICKLSISRDLTHSNFSFE